MGSGKSKLSKTGTSSNNSFENLTKGIKVDIDFKGNLEDVKKEAVEFLQGSNDVFKDFGLDGFKRISLNDEVDQFASVNGFDELTINTKFLKGEKTDNPDYYVATGLYASGAHEAGHTVVNKLLNNKVIPEESNLKKSVTRNKGKLEKAIVKEAIKRHGKESKISDYGSKNNKEKVAEAFCDVYTNKNKANPFSKEIVNVCKDINSGTFKPKIRV